ncbi:hypothetical protein FHR81_001054 [Actinoalloteichus hoggarensis]|uniref:polymorphic toxin-type HINT domain-containing protein n=1 Tax=Actinoalloteichus hoggarensis TaxID=1470176 RepID=UPI0017BEEE0F|nr:polymorphic toxin-type HINT domain-containing protein [Actinoalloteichus hoggarensis]MBB5920024.1 hypothetical protein [Actinoalloteichus hoggarensis]
MSTSPSLPANSIGDLLDLVQDVADSYSRLHQDLLDSSGPVVTNISLHDEAPSEVSYTDPANLVGPAGSCDTSNSFAAGTEVLMADGSTKPIEEVEVGDEVLATDPTTGETGVQPVTATIVGDGVKHLVDITVVTEDGGSDTITATAEHPFWVADLNAWVDAEDLEPGHRFETADHRDASVTAIEAYAAPRQVHNLTVDRLGTYYVAAGTAPVLVHNTNDSCEVSRLVDLIDRDNLTMSHRVEEHLWDIAPRGRWKGERERSFMDYRTVLDAVMDGSDPVMDPRGTKNTVRWDTPGQYRGREGTWELVINAETNMIYHYNFNGRKK